MVVSCTYRVFQHLIAIQVIDILGILVFDATLVDELTVTSHGTRLEVLDVGSLIELTNTSFELVEGDLVLGHCISCW